MKRYAAALVLLVVLGVAVLAVAVQVPLFRNLPCCCELYTGGEPAPANVKEYYGDLYVCSEL